LKKPLNNVVQISYDDALFLGKSLQNLIYAIYKYLIPSILKAINLAYSIDQENKK